MVHKKCRYIKNLTDNLKMMCLWKTDASSGNKFQISTTSISYIITPHCVDI